MALEMAISSLIMGDLAGIGSIFDCKVKGLVNINKHEFLQ